MFQEKSCNMSGSISLGKLKGTAFPFKLYLEQIALSGKFANPVQRVATNDF